MILMDVNVYPDKNRIIRLTEEVVNGQYKGDLLAVSKWMDRSVELCGINFFRAVKQISVIFLFDYNLYHDSINTMPLNLEKCGNHITKNSVFMADLKNCGLLDHPVNLNEIETKDIVKGSLRITMCKNWQDNANNIPFPEYVISRINTQIHSLQKRIISQEDLDFYRNHEIITNLLRDNREEIESFLKEKNQVLLSDENGIVHFQVLQDAAIQFSDCPESLKSLKNFLTDEQVDFSKNLENTLTTTPGEISLKNDSLHEAIDVLEKFRERFKYNTDQMDTLDKKYSFDLEMDER